MTGAGLVLLALFCLLLAAVPVRAADGAAAALAGGDAVLARRLADDALKAPDLAPLTRARLLLDRGLAFELTGAADAALADFTMAINTHALPAGEQGQALLQRGFLLDSMGRLGPALGDYTAVIGLAPADASTALNNRANIYRRQNKSELAKRDYLAALAGDNPHPEYPLTGLGQIAEAEGDTSAARRYYTKALAANARYGLAIDRLAALGGPLADSAQPQQAIHLRPPPGTQDAGGKAPIHLRPPPGMKEATTKAPIHLRPPPVVKPTSAHPGRKPVPPESVAGAYDFLRQAPPLRPAIDGGGGATMGTSMVQLGSWRSRAEAETGWTRALGRAGGALDGLAHDIQTADLPGRGRYYRLKVAPGPRGARALCADLRARGMDCLISGN